MSLQSVAVVVDSTASLPADVASKHRIFVVPMHLTFGAQTFRDGVDIQPAEFYARLAASLLLPKTASPSPGEFLDAFKQASASADSVLCLTLSSQLSSVYEAATLAAAQAKDALPGVAIQVLDTRTAGGAQGLVALAAAEAAARGADLPAVRDAAQRAAERVQFLGVLDSLHYLWKGGRVPRAAMWATSLLQIKPVLDIKDGNVRLVERPRTRRHALDRLLAIAQQRAAGRPVQATVMHANMPADAAELAHRLAEAVTCTYLFITAFTPVIGAHTGPGLLGIALLPSDNH
ncbi:MAG: DegV family protein [Dehalococcoidia bacterium]|nr:DegV family protein [Dehalococcoidia bacterium]